MVIKSMYINWTAYAKNNHVSGVLIPLYDELGNPHMLFGKHRPVLKLARLLGLSNPLSRVGILSLAGPIRSYLCR